MIDLAPHSELFRPVQLGALTLPNRILMAPLTRNRAQDDGTPRDIAAAYYRQRASAGLIFTEATQISAMGVGYINTPGLYTAKHVAGWRKVTDAVHEAGGRIFLQLWHVGRISHSSLLPDNQAPIAPSAIPARAQTFTHEGFVDCSAPRALETDEIAGLIYEYRVAAERALEAGFDGVEVDAGNGYLLDQFLHENANQRRDQYGGSPENRARFPLEVVNAVVNVVGADRVGVRLSPTDTFADMDPTGVEPAFEAVIDGLNPMGLAYLHIVEKFPGSEVSDEDVAMLLRLRARWAGRYIANGDYDAARAAKAIKEGRVDAVAFGRPFLANPDLPERYRKGAGLNEPDPSTFYGGDERGYTDYPFLTEQPRLRVVG